MLGTVRNDHIRGLRLIQPIDKFYRTANGKSGIVTDQSPLYVDEIHLQILTL